MDGSRKRKRKSYEKSWKSASRSIQIMKTKQNKQNDCTDNDWISDSEEDNECETASLSLGPTSVNPSPELGNPASYSNPEELAAQSQDDTETENYTNGNGAEADTGWNLIDNHSTISSEENDEVVDATEKLSRGLAKWSYMYQIKHNATDALLKLLKECGRSDLPASARTLLKTPRNVEIQFKSGMQYIYFALGDMLCKTFKQYSAEERNVIEELKISLNIDGLPLFKSSSMAMWPVLCSINNLKPVTVFPVILTFGKTKPCNLDFLEDIIPELGHLLQNGLVCDGKTMTVSLECIICDAPARCFVKAVKQYSGYYGCDKCDQRGRWIGRVIYPETVNLTLRTDRSFRCQLNEDHHNGVSPFCDLPIDMVKTFPIDYMHQTCLGVTKRLLLVWLRGPRTVRISAGHVAAISQRLIALKNKIPRVCFSRQPRGLDDIDRWKATEFRQFLLYTGKMVLRGILRKELYSHFMSLSVAISILVSPKLAEQFLNYGHKLLVHFVKTAEILYGSEFLVYNVHSLLHLAEEVKTFKSLDKCAAFPFESYMQKLKRMVRSGNHPIAQVAKRLGEGDGTAEPNGYTSKLPKIPIKSPNNAFILENSCCEVIREVEKKDNQDNKLVLCRIYNKIGPLFLQPCDSRIIGAFKCSERNAHMKIHKIKDLQKRAILIKDGNEDPVFLQVLHEI